MSSSAGMLIIYVVAFIAIFYFMAIRPQQKQRKAHAALLSSLKKGDQVVTASGIYGTVKRVEDTVVVIEIARGVSIKIARNAVSQIIRDKHEARAYAPEPTGRRGKKDTLALEEETGVDEASETVDGAEEAESAEEIEVADEAEVVEGEGEDYAASEEETADEETKS